MSHREDMEWNIDTLAVAMRNNPDLAVDKSVNAYVPYKADESADLGKYGEGADRTGHHSEATEGNSTNDSKLKTERTAGSRNHPEDDFIAQIIEVAHLKGWVVAHFRPALTAKGWRTPVQADGAGFPDLVMAHPTKGRLILAECKSDRGKVSAEQQAWLDCLIAAQVRRLPIEIYVWRPSDWDSILDSLE